MAIKPQLTYFVFIAALILSAARCNRLPDDFEANSSFADSCSSDAWFGEMITISDPNESFMISLPYTWDQRESFNDSSYSVFAANFLSIPKKQEEKMAILVSGFNSEMTEEKYAEQEIRALGKEPSIRLLKSGKLTGSDGQRHPWVMFRASGNETGYHLVNYRKHPTRPEVYFIQLISYDTVNYEDKICRLMVLMNSFVFTDEN
ncbi:MAG: hypothetical protein Kow00127_17560 [Bacteroidales bacterium]